MSREPSLLTAGVFGFAALVWLAIVCAAFVSNDPATALIALLPAAVFLTLAVGQLFRALDR